MDRAKGVFMIPALHISTSIAGWSYADANDSTEARSCHTMRKSTALQFSLKNELQTAAYVEVHDAEGNVGSGGRC